VVSVNACPASLATDLFDYPLPEGRIAQTPVEPRDASRLLHLPPSGTPEDHGFGDLPELLRPGDLLVVNDTRVRAARLRGRRPTGGGAEILVMQPLGDGRYACLVRPARRLPPGTGVDVGEGMLTATVGETLRGHPGARAVRFESAGDDVENAIERHGSVPLPPYVHVPLADPARYQTIFAASPPASTAAPTAGLHFTDAVLERLRQRGIGLTAVRLEVGLATFVPIRASRVEDHEVHEERFELSPEAAEAIATTRDQGGRVVAVGTTATRVLETQARDSGLVVPGSGTTRLYLRPGGQPFRLVDGLLTNFHQPRSSLLVLLAAFVGDGWRTAYEHALAHGYRFLSFGDCMLCWRHQER
jgi:S-adenosylmethionine:tRNA ribosyltransferase-isomerase